MNIDLKSKNFYYFGVCPLFFRTRGTGIERKRRRNGRGAKLPDLMNLSDELNLELRKAGRMFEGTGTFNP